MKGLFVGVLLLAAAVAVLASSHGEAPGQLKIPQADATDLYAFMSYEQGRAGYVTMIGLYGPLQDGFAGPNYYSLSNRHFYEILVDNQGYGTPTTTFQFDASSELPSAEGFTLTINGTKTLSVPLKTVLPITASNQAGLNWQQSYTVKVIDSKASRPVVNPRTNGEVFTKPFDNAGSKTFPDYQSYANAYIYSVLWPIARCQSGKNTGKVFVGPRKDPFYIWLGGVFDLVNFVPVDNLPGGRSQNSTLYNHLSRLNVQVFSIEIHKSCLLASGADTIGVWTRSVSKKTRQQVSRMGNPLLNELIIGIDDKLLWNQVEPSYDSFFNDYLQYPSFPKILDILFLATVKSLGGPFASINFIEPQFFPRNDLLAVFHFGVPSVNQLPHLTAADMLRLNTSYTTSNYTNQKELGLLSADFNGWPNGRRPKDDVVDITLRAAMGAVLVGFPGLFPTFTPSMAPIGSVELTDFTPPNAADYIDTFPYLAIPVPGNLVNP